MNTYQDDLVLYHHGIKGQRWGVRRYRNEDGSLTAKGKKRYLKKYEKAFAKYDKDLGKAEGRLRMAAYNKTADEYNSHKIDEYNKMHNVNDPNYVSDYVKQLKRDVDKAFDSMALDFTVNNKHFKEAHSIAEKYGLYSVEGIAKDNHDAVVSWANRVLKNNNVNAVVEDLKGRKNG